MDNTVYADLLFLIDFSMDFLTFYIVARLLRQRPKIIRMCSASAMGGVYSVISLGINVGRLPALVFDIFVCFVMCMTVFLEKDPKRFRKMPLYTLLYFTVSALLGGVMTVIYGFLNRRRASDASVGRNELSLWVFGFVALLSGLVTLLGGNLLGRTSRAKIGRLTVRLGARKVTFEAMSDSGNLLRDPIGGRDVVVVDGKKARNIVPSLALSDAGALPDEMKKRVRMIPVRTASGEGLLEAFVPDDVLLLYDGTEKHIVRLGARKVTFEAMSDSGNLLRDPIGGRDVVVVDGKKARNIVPSLALSDAGALPDEMKKRVRMIPVRTASGEGLLEAFVPDDVLLLYDGTEKHIDVLIAVSKSDLDGGECEAIVPADYFT